jgi:nitrogen fixation protein FixH
MTKELKGFHVLMIALSAFAIIITANLAMLFAATGSFPGLVVKNSYIASQGWNDRTAEQQALGWTTQVFYSGETLGIELANADGTAAELAGLDVTIGRPATDAQDQTFVLEGQSPYRIPVLLAPGKWLVRIAGTGDTTFQTTATLLIPETR